MNTNKKMNPKADLIVDLQYGSTGKGLIAGYLALRDEPDAVVTANMPNAGHTFIDAKGNKMVHKVLPNGVVSPKCQYAMIGPGAVFSEDQLVKELRDLSGMGYDHFAVLIHPNSVILSEKHREAEQEFLRIGSTAQGSAVAMVNKIFRNPEDNPTAGAKYGAGKSMAAGVHIATIDEYNQILAEADNILLEGAQGFSLGLNERFYPFCTSRDCTPARFMADMGIPIPMLRKVIGTARTYPIRVGSPVGGYSGDCYPDQKEITWAHIGVEPELTTVTKRKRRVFTFSPQQIKDAMWACQPDEVFLNFCNYVDNPMDLLEIRTAFGVNKVRYTGWGPTVNDVIDDWKE